MSVGNNSYGSAVEVASLATGIFLSSGAFSPSTTPTLPQVEGWIDSVSATLNVMLAKSGFHIPITQTDAKAACAALVDEFVYEMVQAKNNTGRFYTDKAAAAGRSPLVVLRKEMADWVELMAPGLESLGAARDMSALDGILVKDADVSGREIEPIFQRNGFGNSFDDIAAGEDND